MIPSICFRICLHCNFNNKFVCVFALLLTLRMPRSSVLAWFYQLVAHVSCTHLLEKHLDILLTLFLWLWGCSCHARVPVVLSVSPNYTLYPFPSVLTHTQLSLLILASFFLIAVMCHITVVHSVAIHTGQWVPQHSVPQVCHLCLL